MNGTDTLAVVGVAGVVVGIAGFAGVVVPGLSTSFAFVALVGVLAGVQGLRYVLRRREVDPVTTETGEPEGRYRVPAPGDKPNRNARRFGVRRSRQRRTDSGPSMRPRRRTPQTLRRRIRTAAIETIVLREHCTERTAERLLETGTWTDDPVAAQYLGDDVSVPLSVRLTSLLTRRSGQDRAGRTLDALEDLEVREESLFGAGAVDEPTRSDGGRDRPSDVSTTDARGGERGR